ncbi:unannotated protein [freshwater metagenome]|uniref:Unannotated protein n=1 Tax=freshwater metagenome TaxID=449393 RepID=A0A6J6NQQ4_9ZZZZ
MLFTVRARNPGATETRGKIVISLTVTAGISTPYFNMPRVVEHSTTSNLRS